MQYALRLTSSDWDARDARSVCPASWRELLPQGDVVALYFGTEFCEDRIPSADELAAYCALAHDRGWQPTLLTPLVSDRGLATLDALLRVLARIHQSSAVVFNDWGVLDLLRTRHTGFARRAGRLLNRSLRDPRAYGDAARAPASHDTLRFGRMHRMLATAGVCAIETDPDLEGGFLDRGGEDHGRCLDRTLHVPFTFAASGRHCPLKAGLYAPGEAFGKVLNAPCPAPCRGGPMPVRREDTPLPMWRAGNTLFYETPRETARQWLRHADRVVVHVEAAA